MRERKKERYINRQFERERENENKQIKKKDSILTIKASSYEKNVQTNPNYRKALIFIIQTAMKPGVCKALVKLILQT